MRPWLCKWRSRATSSATGAFGMNTLISAFFFVTCISIFSQARAEAEYCQSSMFASIKLMNSEKFPALSCAEAVPVFETALINVQKVSPIDLSKTALVIYNQALAKGATYSWVTSTVTIDVPSIAKIEE